MSVDGLAQSQRFGTFALVFGVSFPIFYVLCDMARLPLFTYHPGADLFEWGFARARRGEGPAMYWYGWLASSCIGSAVVATLAALLSQRITKAAPLALAWIVPVGLTPLLLYSLKYYWRW